IVFLANDAMDSFDHSSNFCHKSGFIRLLASQLALIAAFECCTTSLNPRFNTKISPGHKIVDKTSSIWASFILALNGPETSRMKPSLVQTVNGLHNVVFLCMEYDFRWYILLELFLVQKFFS
ncbi:hypothetical protein DERF_012511, partial [Dermatophagoides farinae]